MKKSKFKKLFVTVIVAVLTFVLTLFSAACSSDTNPSTPNTPSDTIGDNTGTGDNAGTDDNNTEDNNNDNNNTDDNNNDNNNNNNDDDENNGDDNNDDDNNDENAQLRIKIKQLLAELVRGYKLDPYSYIPEAMLPTHTTDSITDSTPKTEADYASFVGKSNMPDHGFGEQWNMIAENLAQSQTFFKALSAADSAVSAAVATFNNYIDSNPSDTAQHSFMHGIYSVTIRFDGSRIFCVLDYTVGGVKAQIAMSMGMVSKDKVVRVQLGAPNALTYTVTQNSYEFAIKYAGVRRAYFSVSRDENNKVNGHIYEYLTVSGVTDKAIASAADFYVDGNYVTAVGNKADGMIAFDGYISELYDKTTGKLISYEVREERSSLTFNTLWYDLADISGINSVRYYGEEDKEKFYVNGSDTAWENKKVGGLSLKTASRRFDIEFRTQYFYVSDGNDGVQKVAVKVPMLFVQEEQADDLVNDVKATNKIDITVNVSASDKAKQKSDYNTLVDVFIAHKQAVTVERIIEFIGDAIEFEAAQ